MSLYFNVLIYRLHIKEEMEDFKLNTPVVFIIFNRPDTTKKVFEEIKKAQPRKLFVISDGPRNESERDKVKEARSIINGVDWDCEVLKNYSDVNLGLKKRVSSGIDWVFENTEEAIFLEDDCLPHQSFFRFCQELLQFYKNDDRIMFISGNNFQFNRRELNYSYYFSSYNHVWGWATWKRCWDKYDVNMKHWPEIKEKKYLEHWLGNKKAAKYWTEEFQRTYEGKTQSWAYQLLFTCWTNNGLTILPNKNLVSNIGFGSGATNTSDNKNIAANIPAEEMQFPLKHPSFFVRDREADRYEEENIFLPKFPGSLKIKFKRMFE